MFKPSRPRDHSQWTLVIQFRSEQNMHNFILLITWFETQWKVSFHIWTSARLFYCFQFNWTADYLLSLQILSESSWLKASGCVQRYQRGWQQLALYNSQRFFLWFYVSDVFTVIGQRKTAKHCLPESLCWFDFMYILYCSYFRTKHPCIEKVMCKKCIYLKQKYWCMKCSCMHWILMLNACGHWQYVESESVVIRDVKRVIWCMRLILSRQKLGVEKSLEHHVMSSI